jgi:hypothetical protein
MDKNPLNQGVVIAHGRGVGVVTKKMIHERAAEIALINGRNLHQHDQSDWEQARRELSGGPEVDPETAILESLCEADRSNELPEAEACRAPESPLEDEDEEGRSETEQLVEEGAQEAARDQRLAAARVAQKEDEAL